PGSSKFNRFWMPPYQVRGRLIKSGMTIWAFYETIIVVTRKGEPVALVSLPPPPPQKDSWLGSMKDTIQVTGDIISPVVDENEWEAMKD
ncbi:MAG: hypothetical protein JW821_04905, partial [Deltaproteobacteria bacterium]|nr:hypothetical protein [Deltaproteobacteria bacterium]